MTAIGAIHKGISLFINGILLLAIGVLVQLYKLGVGIDAPFLIGKFWPVALLAFGLKYIFISLIRPNKYFASDEEEEAGLYILHQRNPVSGIIWGSGFIAVGVLVLLKARHGFNLLGMVQVYWPLILVVAGINGIVSFFFILYRYGLYMRRKKSDMLPY